MPRLVIRRTALAALCLGAAACVPDTSTSAGGETRTGQTVLRTSVTLTTEGVQRAIAVAETAFVNQDSLRLDFRLLRLTIFAPDGEPVAVLSAPRALHRIGGDTLVASGGVTVVTPRGDTLTAPTLGYLKGEMRFWADSGAVLSGRGGARRGNGFASDVRLRNPRFGTGGT